MSHFNRMSQENLITIIWVLSHLHSKFLYKNYHNKRSPFLNLHKYEGQQNKKKKHRKTTSNTCPKYLQKINFVTAKADFDKYVKKNLINSKKTLEKDSITAKESQIRDLLMDSQENKHSRPRNSKFRRYYASQISQ